MNELFAPADILLPAACDMRKWAVVACDQFSSQEDYWDRVETLVGDAPSTLRMIVPEARLGREDASALAAGTFAAMKRYLTGGVFREIPASFVYVRRTQSDGRIRQGLVGALDLEVYDYEPGTDAPVRASEHTVASRLPVRIQVRRGASLELPHVMVLLEDPEKKIIEPLAAETAGLEKLYDFDLMEGGGHLAGWRVTGKRAGEIARTVSGQPGPVKLIVGDGNHSLAAAREFWNRCKTSLTPEQRRGHPARYALVEVNNVYDEAIAFDAIHRVVFGARDSSLAEKLAAACPGSDYAVTCVTAAGERRIALGASGIGELIERIDRFLEEHLEPGARIDYIHGREAATSLGRQKDAAALLLPAMGKGDFFKTVIRGGLFPKKSFSIGRGPDKRYYMECRKIVP
ncbi:MAG: DUF1015 domain-containing protein [Oscillospiraceae bacterium]|nr:DUF1015 domain-containing protein [Oscillospiraceae bacterium]